MDVSALLAEYRRRADDAAGAQHHTDAQLIPLLAEAEREACLRSHPLFDCETDGVAVYPVTAGQTSLSLDPLVVRVDHAAFTPTGSTRACKVDLTGIDAIREAQHRRGGTIVSSRPDLAAHSARTTLTLFPASSIGGTLSLDVYRLPLADLEAVDDEPEIPAELHAGLVDWVLYRVYSSKDGEVEDTPRAAQALADFTARFGERRDAEAQRRHRERRRVTTGNHL